MSIQTKRPDVRGYTSGLDIDMAAKLWNAGYDTQHISEAMGIPESSVYRHIETIRTRAFMFRSALYDPFHKDAHNLAHRPQSLGLHNNLPPVVGNSHNSVHSGLSLVSSVGAFETDTGEFGNVPKRFGQTKIGQHHD